MPKILHIEDDPANRLLVRKLLTPAGFEVVDAADGLDGIRKARSERPDLVLVDIAIPGLDGYEVTLRLKAEPQLEGMPIVAITAEGNRDASLAVGCDGFLQKPIDARSFANTVRGYLQGKREHTSPDLTGEHLRYQSQRIVGHLEEKVAELMSANARLVDVDNARKEFYRNVSHELATPMTPIVGYLKLLLDGELGPLNAHQDKSLRAMDQCVERLRGLIDNLLDITGLETGRIRFMHRDYNLMEVARAAVVMHSAQLDERRLRLVTEMPRGALPGYGDADRLARAIGQIIENAIKFTPEGGMIGVRVRAIGGSRYEICVADSGPGVAPDVQPRLFDAFYQVDGSETRAHGGTGVGLAIVRGIARGHGGDVRVESPSTEVIRDVPLRGAAFTLEICQRAPVAYEPLT